MNQNIKSNLLYLMILIIVFGTSDFLKQFSDKNVSFDEKKQTNIIKEYIKTPNIRKETWNNGAIKQIFELNELNKKNGFALVFFNNGNLKEKAIYENNILKEIEKYNNDSFIQKKIICKDKKNCTQTTFKENGKIDSIIDIIYFSENSFPIFNGKYIQYHYDKDYITSITNYKDGLENGLYQTFREDGKIHTEVTYINGKREGKETIYNNDGTIFGEVFYENNIEIKK